MEYKIYVVQTIQNLHKLKSKGRVFQLAREREALHMLMEGLHCCPIKRRKCNIGIDTTRPKNVILRALRNPGF